MTHQVVCTYIEDNTNLSLVLYRDEEYDYDTYVLKWGMSVFHMDEDEVKQLIKFLKRVRKDRWLQKFRNIWKLKIFKRGETTA